MLIKLTAHVPDTDCDDCDYNNEGHAFCELFQEHITFVCRNGTVDTDDDYVPEFVPQCKTARIGSEFGI